MKKLLYIFILAVFMLTACGKSDTDKKDPVQSEKEESQKQNKEESLDKDEDSQDSDGELSNTDKKTEDKSSTEIENEEDNDSLSGSNTPNNNSSNDTTTQKPTGGINESNGSTTQDPTTGSNAQKPSNNSSNTGGSTNTGGSPPTTKTPVKRVSEEVKSAVVPYKYGITKYDVTTNNYTLYSDGSKELLDSSSYTVYDSSNYSATDSQLKSEADSNASKYMSYYQEVLHFVNEIRAEVGVAPMTLDTILCEAASMRALEMDYGNEMSHTRPSGKDCFSVLDFYGISFGTCGENIAAGQTSAASVVKDWKNSPGHYENMVNPSYTKLGVGYSASGVGDYGHYWCQLFTN